MAYGDWATLPIDQLWDAFTHGDSGETTPGGVRVRTPNGMFEGGEYGKYSGITRSAQDPYSFEVQRLRDNRTSDNDYEVSTYRLETAPDGTQRLVQAGAGWDPVNRNSGTKDLLTDIGKLAAVVGTGWLAGGALQGAGSGLFGGAGGAAEGALDLSGMFSAELAPGAGLSTGGGLSGMSAMTAAEMAGLATLPGYALPGFLGEAGLLDFAMPSAGGSAPLELSGQMPIEEVMSTAGLPTAGGEALNLSGMFGGELAPGMGLSTGGGLSGLTAPTAAEMAGLATLPNYTLPGILGEASLLDFPMPDAPRGGTNVTPRTIPNRTPYAAPTTTPGTTPTTPTAPGSGLSGLLNPDLLKLVGPLVGGLLGNAVSDSPTGTRPATNMTPQQSTQRAPTMRPWQPTPSMPNGLGSQSAGLFDEYLKQQLGGGLRTYYAPTFGGP